MKSVRMLLAFGLLTQLCACVEIRDNKKEETPPMVRLQNMGDLTVDEDMYVYDGRILNQKDLKRAEEDNADIKKTVGHDFELSFERLTITDRGHLYTMGNNVRFHIQDLKTTSGTIATFPESQTAPTNTAGRSGGHILLDVVEGDGVLVLIMRGENGGAGSKGVDGASGKDGGDGRDGGELQLLGMGPVCLRDPVKGTAGEAGGDGQDGGNGLTGGDSGTLEIRMKTSTVTVADQSKPGKGGPGAEGGKGGLGGVNGRDGRCPGSLNAMPKTRAANGKDGSHGRPGPDGLVQTIYKR